MKLRSRYLVLTVVAIIVAVLLPAVAYYRWARLEVAQEIIATSVNLMAGEADRAKRELDYAIGRTRNEVLSLANMPPVEGIGRAIETGGFDAVEQSSLDLWRGRLASIFAASITYGYPKTQLRLIGVADGGRELVRVDQSPTGDSQAVIAPAGALQKQGDRYYFREALALAPGEIYLSQIDLNVEQGKVAQPEMPTLRAATAVRTGRGDVYGVIVANYAFRDVLADLEQVSDPRLRSFLIDEGGRYLARSDQGKTFAHERGSGDGSGWAEDYALEPGVFESLGVTPPRGLQARRGREGVMLFLPPIATILGSPGRPMRVRHLVGMPLAAVESEISKRSAGLLMAAAGPVGVGLLLLLLVSGLFTRRQLLQERALAQSRERAARAGHAGLWEYDPATGNLDCNDEMLRIHGIENEKGIDIVQALRRSVHPDDWGRVRSALNVASGEELGLEFRIVRPDGALRHVQIRGAFEAGPDRRRGRWTGTEIDITARKEEGQALRQFKSTLDATRDGVLMFRPETLQFFYANQGASALIGYSEAELLQRKCFDIKPGMSESMIRQLFAPLLAGDQTDMRYVTELKHKDGHEVPVEAFIQLVAPPDEPARCVAIITDISERVKTERERAEQLRLETLAAEIGQALNTAADAEEALRECAGAMANRLRAVVELWTLGDDRNTLELQASEGRGVAVGIVRNALSIDGPVLGRIALTRAPYVSLQADRDPDLADDGELLAGGMTTFAGYPMVVEDGLVGVMAYLARTRPSPAELRALEALAGQIAIGVHRKWMRKEALVSAQNRLQDSYRNLKRVLDDSADAVLITDMEHAVKFANRAAFSLFGDLLTRPDEMLPLLQYEGAGAYDLTDSAGTPKTLEKRSGETDWFGAPALMVTFHDVTAHRRLQSELDELRQAAERAEQQLRWALEALADGFVLFDSEDRLVLCNDRYRQIYAESAELLSPGVRFEDLIREGVRRGQYPEAIGREEAWIAERMAQHLSANSVVTQKLPNGRWLRIEERRTPDGGVVGLRIDVTELKLAQQQAESASRAKSEFVANMSHEIRTPLSGVIGMMDLLQSTPLSEVQAEYLESARTSANALFEVLSDVLDFSKIEAQRLELDRTAFRLEWEVAAVKQMFEPLVRDKGLSLALRDETALQEYVLGDPVRVRQILRNLLANALKFTEHGGIEIRMRTMSAEDRRVRVRIEVGDTGIGISPERQAHLFEPFSQADASITRRYGGTGLGLAICQAIVGAMGGTIDLHSVPGEGSVFGVELPFETTPAQLPRVGAVREAWTAPGGVPLSERISGLDVVLVDDSEINRIVGQRQLARVGAKVRLADSADAALALFAEQRPELVLTDLQMPGMSGFDLAERIRGAESAAGVHVPIIALTARAQAGERERCLEAGIDGLVVKPYTLVELLAEIERVLFAEQAGGVDEAAQPQSARFADALARLDGDEEVFAAAARAALEAFAGSRERLSARRAGDSLDNVASEAHKLIFGWSLFALPEQASMARLLEQAARAGDAALTDQLRTRFIGQLAAVEDELREWLAGVAGNR